MARLIFVRHSTPSVDPAIPSRDWPLSIEGIEAATRLAAQLPPLTAVLSSDEPKARQTAQVIADYHDAPLHLDPDLREHGRISAGYQPREAFEAGIGALFAQPNALIFGDESADQVFTRVQAAIARISGLEGDVALVSHGTALSIYLSRLTGSEPFAFWKSLTMPMALAVEDDRLVILG